MLSFSGLLKDERRLLIILLLLYLATRLPLLNYLPFIKDEGIYAMMALEQASAPSLVPTFMGYPVGWKPAPFFWLHSPLLGLPLPLEAAFRLPSFIAGLATIPLLFGILRNTGATPAISFFSVLIFTLSLPSMYPDAAMLTDSINFMLVCCSLCLYTAQKLPKTRFLAAGAFVFLAFFIKLVLAFMAPLLAVVFLWHADRKSLRNPLFLLSLAAAPAAFVLNFAVLETSSLAHESLAANVIDHIISPGGFEMQLEYFTGSMSAFLVGAGLWFALSLAGAWMHWRHSPMMTLWYLLSVFPMLSGSYMIWYFLPVMPAISYFAAMVLLRWDNTDKADLFFAMFFAAVTIISVSYLYLFYEGMHASYNPEREAGLMMAGKENVLIIGNYPPSVAAYKTLSELRSGGKALDYGYITSNRLMNDTEVQTFLNDYRSEEFPVHDGSFNSFFSRAGLFRKDTNITDFGYIVLSGSFNAPEGASVIYNSTTRNLSIYEVN
ncbi:MAG: glycosyltransferase family 39 protein [Candidatus Micrarchaeota archaeon]